MKIEAAKIYVIVRTILISLAVLFIVFLIGRDFSLSGSKVIVTNFKKFTPFISILTPTARVKLDETVLIEQEPVYFDLYLPRDFDQAQLQFTYNNNQNNIIEVGAQVGENNWQLKPINNDILNNLVWPRQEQDGVILWQKDNKYQSLEDFFFNLPASQEIALYNFDLGYDFQIADYQPSQQVQEIKKDLQGFYQIYTYVKDENLDWEFDFWQMEDGDGLAQTYIDLYDANNNLLDSYPIENNKIVIAAAGLSAGVYRLNLEADGLVMTKAIRTRQRYITFVNNLKFDQPAEVYTQAKNLTFLTYENKGLQTVMIDGKELVLAEIWQQFKSKEAPGLKKLKIPKGAMILTVDGLLSFSPEQYFNPLLTKVTTGMDLDKEGIKYVLAYYTLPTGSGDFKTNQVEFNLAENTINNGYLRFIISVPDLELQKQPVALKDLQIKLSRDKLADEGLLANIYNYFRYYKNEIEK